MWIVIEGPRTRKSIKRLPFEILKRYEKWKKVIELSGPQSLRILPGLADEALMGEWFGYRSSRLNIKYRVIYRVDNKNIIVEVFDINAHDYRR